MSLAGVVLFGEARRKRRFGSRRFAFFLSVFCIFLCCSLMLLRCHQLYKSWWQGDCTLQGIVVSQPKVYEKTSSAFLQLLVQQRGDSVCWDHRKIQVTWLNDSTKRMPRPGEAWMFYGTVKRPEKSQSESDFDYASWLYAQGVSGVTFVGVNYQECSSSTQKRLLQQLSRWEKCRRWMLWQQERLCRMLSAAGIDGAAFAIISAMSIGNKSHLTQEIRQLFSQTGVSHVLALSGLHLGILVSLLLFLLRPLQSVRRGRWLTTVLCLLLVWSFALLTGLNISLVRSAVMYSLFLLFHLRGESSHSLRDLGIAAVLILVVQPMALLDVGFQLSFLSVFFILYLQPYYKQIRPRGAWKRRITDFLYISITAQIATAPVVAYSFHTFPLWFLLSNVIAIPCAYLLLGGVLLFFVMQPISGVSLWIAQGLTAITHFMLWFLQGIASIPCSHLELYPSGGTCILCYILIFAIIRLRKRRKLTWLLTVIAVVILLTGSILRDAIGTAVQPQVKYYNDPSVGIVHFIQSREVSYIWLSRPEKEQKVREKLHVYWRKRHLAEPILLKNGMHNTFISMQEDIVTWQGKRWVLLSSNNWQDKTAGQPLPVDVLYIAKGCYLQPEDIAQIFTPKEVILSSDLPQWLAEKYKKTSPFLVHSEKKYELCTR